MSDGTLYFKIEMDTEEVQRGLKKVKDEVKENGEVLDSTTKKTNKNLQTLKNTAKLVGTYLVGKFFKETITKGVEFNKQIEQYTTSFEVMLGSAERSKDLMKDLVNYANKTPFDTVTLADSTQLLLNYGIQSERVMDVLGQLGDIAQGSGEKLSGIALAYGQMSSLGKVTLQDIKQMIERGFNPLQEISETTGESMGSLYDRISKGTLAVDEITESMKRSTAQGGKYFGSMDKQSKTLDGQMSTLSDTWTAFLGEAVEPLSNYLRDVLIPNLISFLENIEEYKPVFTYLGILIGTVTSLWVAYNVQQALASANLTVWGAICKGATILTTALGTAVNFLTSGVGLAIIGVGLFIAILKLLYDNSGAVWSVLSSLNEWLKEHLFKDWTEVFGVLGEIINGFASTVETMVYMVIETFHTMIRLARALFNGDWKNVWREAIAFVLQLFGTIGSALLLPINAVLSVINTAIGLINKINVKIPTWVPIFGGKDFSPNIPKIPYLEKGGILAKGQVGYLEGNGAEAVVPLDRNKHWIKAVAKEMAFAQSSTVTNNNGQTVIFNKEVSSISEVSRRLRVDARLGLVG